MFYSRILIHGDLLGGREIRRVVMVRSCNVLAFVAMEVEAFLETQVLPFFFLWIYNYGALVDYRRNIFLLEAHKFFRYFFFLTINPDLFLYWFYYFLRMLQIFLILDWFQILKIQVASSKTLTNLSIFWLI